MPRSEGNLNCARVIASAILALLFSTTGAPRASALTIGDGASTTTDSVTVAVVDSFANRNAIAYVVRGKGVSGGNVILVERSALTPELIAATARALAVSVRRHGIKARTPVEVVFLAGRPLPPLEKDLAVWARTTLSALQTAASGPVDGFGQHQAVTVSVPIH